MQAHSEQTVIVGDNLRTDILAGFQAGLETILVLSGVPRSMISTACRSALPGFIPPLRKSIFSK
jgi:ribonucleotide monophosphatase NagD (HAD superfamily)